MNRPCQAQECYGFPKYAAEFSVAGAECCSMCLANTVRAAMARLKDVHVGVWTLTGSDAHYALPVAAAPYEPVHEGRA